MKPPARMPLIMNNLLRHYPTVILTLAFCLTLPLDSLYCRAKETPAVLLSVQDFEPIGVERTLARSVSDLVRSELGRSARLRLLEETGRLYRIQRESARFRDLFSEGSLRRLGELLESRFVLTGSVSRLEGVLVITARVINAESGEVLASEVAEHRGSLSEIGSTVRSLARRVLAYFPLTGRVVELRGDTLMTDIGLVDGILPGQELTVADMEFRQTGLATAPLRSARYRVSDAGDRKSSLVPLIRGARHDFGAGSRVVAVGGLEALLRPGAQKKDNGFAELDKAGFGAVLIQSKPESALAILAGLDVGRTPVKVSQLAAGRHELILSLPGYIEIFDSVTVIPETLQEYNFELQQQTGRLTIITSRPDVRLLIDTLELAVEGTGQVVLEDFPAGAHRIEARKQGYKTWRQTVEISFEQDSTLEISLEPYPGSLLVSSQPSGADIYIDGVFTGKVTPWRLARLESGLRVIRTSITGYGAAVDTVEVAPGKDITLELALQKGWFDYAPIGMALVPGGELVYPGGDTVLVDSFYIDLYEVTNRAYAYFISATAHKAPAHWKDGIVPPGEEEHPVMGVSFEEAARFAAWAGKRLPTEEEWELAAMGNTVCKFPWGDSHRPGASNIWSEGLNNTVAVGSYPEDLSPFGLYDVVGNVAEWVDSWLGPQKLYRTYRGGSYYVNMTDPSLFSRDGHYPNSSNKYVGFRCARDMHVRR
jgi:TolB-like protein